MGNPTEKAAMSIADAAHYSGLSRSSLYRMIDAGTLVSLKIGARRLIRRTELDALLDQASHTGTSDAA